MIAQLAPFRLPLSPTTTDVVATYFRALGDPTRLRILKLLREQGELSVGELAERLEIAQPKVSNHLAGIRWCGFVVTRRQHRTVYNRIADERVAEIADLACALLEEQRGGPGPVVGDDALKPVGPVVLRTTLRSRPLEGRRGSAGRA